MEYSDTYKAYMGMAPKKIPHWEHWSDPDAETYLTGIDIYEHPRLCRQKMAELYPQLGLGIPESDDPIARPTGDDVSNHTVRWGSGQTATWEHGAQFKDADDVFAFSPL
ncbi:MAG: hypothetical protein IJF23_05105, partial [Clostridia bacterium]|nr:hypothetical protein [Clostridia bacterium]